MGCLINAKPIAKARIDGVVSHVRRRELKWVITGTLLPSRRVQPGRRTIFPERRNVGITVGTPKIRSVFGSGT